MDEALILLALLLLGGGKTKTVVLPPGPVNPNLPRQCEPGMRWSIQLDRCVQILCPDGSVRDEASGLCIPKDGPVPEPELPDVGDVDAILDDYPTDNAFFKVSSGWIFSGVPSSSNPKRILYDAIAQRAFLVGRNTLGMNDDQARAYGKSVASQQSNRSALMSGIQREPWNDQLYGTYGYSSLAAPDACTGRAIRLLPQHADNAQRMRDGLAPIRSIQLRTPNDKKKGNGLAAPGAPKGNFEVIWINPIDAPHLAETGQVRVLMAGPPQWIKVRGIDDRSGAPANTKWGC
jgi:hypothetical protein